MDIINRDLHVMDLTAVTLCRENNMTIVAFGLDSDKGLVKAAMGEKIGTLIK